MATRYIYLSDELNNRLKTETNASQLITQLLNKHYETLKINNMTKEQKEKRLEYLKLKVLADKKLKELQN